VEDAPDDFVEQFRITSVEVNRLTFYAYFFLHFFFKLRKTPNFFPL
jgi:hypothetical protein